MKKFSFNKSQIEMFEEFVAHMAAGDNTGKKLVAVRTTCDGHLVPVTVTIETPSDAEVQQHFKESQK